MFCDAWNPDPAKPLLGSRIVWESTGSLVDKNIRVLLGGTWRRAERTVPPTGAHPARATRNASLRFFQKSCHFHIQEADLHFRIILASFLDLCGIWTSFFVLHVLKFPFKIFNFIHPFSFSRLSTFVSFPSNFRPRSKLPLEVLYPVQFSI